MKLVAMRSIDFCGYFIDFPGQGGVLNKYIQWGHRDMIDIELKALRNSPNNHFHLSNFALIIQILYSDKQLIVHKGFV